MPKILFAYPEVSPLYINGGIGTYVFEAAHLLATSGRWEVDILTDLSVVPESMQPDLAKAQTLFRRSGIRLYDLDRQDMSPSAWDSPDLIRADRYYRHVARLHQERRYDLIEFPEWGAPGFFAVRHKRTTGALAEARLVLHLHSSTKDIWDWQHGSFMNRHELYAHYMEEYVKTYADAILSPTEFLLGPVRSRQAVLEKVLIRNGYPITSGSETAVAARPRSSSDGALTVACISRLELRKGQDIFAHAIKRLYKEGALDPRIEFIMCGTDSLGLDRDGSMSRSVRRILEGIPQWTIIPPKPRHELMAWLATEVDISVVPSRVDNYPNVVIEAARAGCYQVCSDGGGTPEILQDYAIDATVFHTEDADGLAEALRGAIQRIKQEPGIRARLARDFESARQRHCVKSLAAYDQLLSETSESRSVLRPRRPAAPKVSIIIPFYNAQQYARETLQSAFASRYDNFEVILVNDGSDSPEAQAFLRQVGGEFPSLRIVNKPNGGLGDARNAGLKVAAGEYVVPLDADNQLLPDMLQRCSRVLDERPYLSYVTTYFECVREADGAKLSWQESPIAKPLGAVDPLILLENTVGDALAMIRRSDIERVGGYSTSIYCFEDWDLWLRFHEKGMLGDVLPEVHFVYRIRANSMSRSVDAWRGVRLQQSLLMKHQGMMRDQALSITTLLLNEFWGRWRSQVPVKPDDAWDTLMKAVRLFTKNPWWTLRYVTGRLMRGAAR